MNVAHRSINEKAIDLMADMKDQRDLIFAEVQGLQIEVEAVKRELERKLGAIAEWEKREEALLATNLHQAELLRTLRGRLDGK